MFVNVLKVYIFSAYLNTRFYLRGNILGPNPHKAYNFVSLITNMRTNPFFIITDCYRFPEKSEWDAEIEMKEVLLKNTYI